MARGASSTVALPLYTGASSIYVSARSRGSFAGERKREVERRARGLVVRDPDTATVSLDDGLRDREAHPHPRGLRGVERLEDQLVRALTKSRAGVLHG